MKNNEVANGTGRKETTPVIPRKVKEEKKKKKVSGRESV
jgi:hypothetical protein